MLELGEDWRDLGKAQQSQDPRYLFRLLRNYPHEPLRTKPKLIVTQGMGYGGGSLVYSGIHLRAPAQAFEGWPVGWTRARLDPYYARVEARLGVAEMPDALEFGRPKAFAEGARARGPAAGAAEPARDGRVHALRVVRAAVRLRQEGHDAAHVPARRRAHRAADGRGPPQGSVRGSCGRTLSRVRVAHRRRDAGLSPRRRRSCRSSATMRTWS